MSEKPTLLITVTGKDRPGVTAAVFAALSKATVEVLDIEQIVLRGRLVLGILITAPRDLPGLESSVASTATDLGMEIELLRGVGDYAPRRGGRRNRATTTRC